jgi:hypothetical protein
MSKERKSVNFVAVVAVVALVIFVANIADESQHEYIKTNAAGFEELVKAYSAE